MPLLPRPFPAQYTYRPWLGRSGRRRGWTPQEFGGAPLGDRRLSARLMQAAGRSRRAWGLLVPRQSARPKRAKQQAQPQQAARTPELALQYQAVHLRPPPYHQNKPPIPLWVVHAREEHPARGTSPVKWSLLTTLAIASPAGAA